MISLRSWPWLFLLLPWCCPSPGGALAAATIAGGDPFPEVALPAPSDAAQRRYLGLAAGGTFVLSQVRGDVVLVELLNVHCPHCRMQAPSYNELYRLIEDDPATRGRIKLLGVGVGNLPAEIERFRSALEIPFPVLEDAQFHILRALGVRATPFSIYVRQRGPGLPGVVVDTHLGLNTDYEPLLARLRALSDTAPGSLPGREAGRGLQAEPAPPVYAEEEVRARIREVIRGIRGGPSQLAPLSLPSGRRVYAATTAGEPGERRLFAEVVSRVSVCDICHALHFLYVFDAAGRIVAFEPLQLTKYGNVRWNAADVEQMRERVVGRSLVAPPPFDPAVDAVTSATITSSMIFDSLSQGEALLNELDSAGLR